MKLKRWSSIIMVGAGLAAAGTAGAQVAGAPVAAAAAQQPGGMPNVVGLRLDSASKVMTRYKLLPRFDAKSDGSKPAATDTVIQQRPVAGQPIPITRVITLTLRTPPSSATDGDPPASRQRVPNITGLTLDSARQVIRVAELTMRTTSTPANVSITGRDIVSQQSPQARSPIPADRTITATVRADLIPVPDVFGLALATARGRLGRFQIREQYAPNAAQTSTIFQQDPAPRTLARPQSIVTIYIAQPLRSVPQIVPNVVGALVQDANNTLVRAGFHTGRITDDDDANVGPGVVVTQVPRGNTSADTAIPVALSVRSNRVRMPSVLTLSEADARQQIISRGLQVGTIDPRDDAATPGSIVSQSLASGTLVERGTAVSLSVARPVAFPMPNLIGFPRTTALEFLDKRHLVVSLIDTSATQARLDTVVAQDPPAQTPMHMGDRVRFTLGTHSLAQTPPVTPVPPRDSVVATPVTPTRTPVVVPDIVGLSRVQATAVAQRAGFTLLVSPGQSPGTADTVVKQFPAARSSVTDGSLMLLAEFSEIPVPARPLWVVWLALGISVLGAAVKFLRPKPTTPVVFPPLTYKAGIKAPTFSITERRSSHGLDLSLSVKNDPGAQGVVVSGPERH